MLVRSLDLLFVSAMVMRGDGRTCLDCIVDAEFGEDSCHAKLSISWMERVSKPFWTLTMA